MKKSDGCGESSAEQKGASAQMHGHERRKNKKTLDAGDVVRDLQKVDFAEQSRILRVGNA